VQCWGAQAMLAGKGMRRALLILILLIAGGSAMLLVLVNPFSVTSPTPQLPSSTPQLPEAAEVESITAEVLGTTEMVRVVPEFAIPAHYFPVILGVLRPPKCSDYPASWDDECLGSFTIKTKTGRSLQITYCFSGKNRLHFTVDGMRFVRGGEFKSLFKSEADELWVPECTMVAAIVSEVYRELKTGEQSKTLRGLIKDMEISRGERPPRD
jgi:hypothetical protein